jgi:hypothetical protein
MSVPQTKATLTVYYVRRTGFLARFWPIKSVAILCHKACPIPNLSRNNACVMQRHPWTGNWEITMELHQWRGENIGETAITRSVNHTDEEYLKIWENIHGKSSFRGIELTEERVIGWLLGLEPWNKTTWKALNF